jgi:hypothetical protein
MRSGLAPSDDGKFASGLWIEIGAAGTAIHCDKSEAEIGEPRGIVSTAGDISRDINHGVVDTLIPFQRPLVKHVGKSRRRQTAEGSGEPEAEAPRISFRLIDGREQHRAGSECHRETCIASRRPPSKGTARLQPGVGSV